MEREYAFLAHMIPPEMKASVYQNTHGSMQDAADALQWHIYHGLAANLQKDIRIFNFLPISSYPQYYNQAFIAETNFDIGSNRENTNIGFCNIKLIRNGSKRVHAYRVLKRWLETSDTPKMLFLYTASDAFLSAIEKLKEKYDLKVCVIIADLPNMNNLSSKKSFLLKKFAKYSSDRAYSKLYVIDYYVLLTKHMADYMKLDKPYCVMEGIATAKGEFSVPDYDQSLKTIFYAGTLHRRFGVLNLLKAFEGIEDPDYRLVLCGIGDSEQEIRAAAKEDTRIQFYGQLPRTEVLKLQAKATVLVNPRQNNEEFTKYSFPSKNLEYLSSGIPFVAYKLDGIPDEYDDYILYVKDNEISSLRDRVMEICEKSSAERKKIGEKARQFVGSEKNELVQTRKMISFLNNCEQRS